MSEAYSFSDGNEGLFLFLLWRERHYLYLFAEGKAANGLLLITFPFNISMKCTCVERHFPPANTDLH